MRHGQTFIFIRSLWFLVESMAVGAKMDGREVSGGHKLVREVGDLR